MRRMTGATHSGAMTSICAPRRRANRGCAISASPIQFGATTRMRCNSMPFDRRALVEVHRAAIRTARLAFARHVEKDAGVPRPKRRARHRAVEGQVLLGYFDFFTGVS